MDAFRLRETVVADYADYLQSFLAILDPRIRTFVDRQLADGMLWPDPLLQLSPAYAAAERVNDLAAQAVLHPLSARLFQIRGQPLRLHQHQRTAIDLAARGLPYVVTTGTGSGKSLTYLIPIVDAILRSRPEDGGVRAIIVYPMNALINSQEDALKGFAANLGGGHACPVRFARYTGQESDADKQTLREHPPHILLTNYVMLELMLTRPEERVFFAHTDRLQFLVLDELHTYRGRQGADVALLVRRLRERSGNPTIQCIGTSATMASAGSRDERNSAVAASASTIFGVSFGPEQVVDETLFLDDEPAVDVAGLHRGWDRAAEREKLSRSRFAQHAIKPEEVAQELYASDSVLGSPATVVAFVRAAPTLAEELIVAGFEGRPGNLTWLDEASARGLLDNAQPSGNLAAAQRNETLQQTLDWLPELQDDLNALAQARAVSLLESHRRVRQATRAGRVSVRPNLPLDLLGVYVLLPMPKGIA